jgi:hypothetical protein
MSNPCCDGWKHGGLSLRYAYFLGSNLADGLTTGAGVNWVLPFISLGAGTPIEGVTGVGIETDAVPEIPVWVDVVEDSKVLFRLYLNPPSSSNSLDSSISSISLYVTVLESRYPPPVASHETNSTVHVAAMIVKLMRIQSIGLMAGPS